MKTHKHGILKLVWDSESAIKAKQNKESHDLFVQMDMFSSRNENSIFIVYFSDIDGKSFSDALNDIHPEYIIDMRPNPRFDIPGYSRKKAFSEFHEIGIKYFDYVELLDGNDRDKSHILIAVKKLFEKIQKGPFAIIFGNREQDELYEEQLLKHLPENKKVWELSFIQG